MQSIDHNTERILAEQDNGKRERASRVKDFLEGYRIFFETRLRELCEASSEKIGLSGTPPRLLEAMRYSLLAGGKRLRPVLCLAAAERCGVAPEDAFPVAAGYEMLHTASLIFDDLPCMDNDDLRRGRPTSHKVFGEALALTGGNALQSWAFEYPLKHSSRIAPERLWPAVLTLIEASGPAGVYGGQVLDMEGERAGDTRNTDAGSFVLRLAEMKTAALIRGALVSGAQLGGIAAPDLKRYSDYGTHLGIAFQIVDDILDVTSDAVTLGKTPGKDQEQNKRTFVSVYGLQTAQEMAEKESALASAALAPVCSERDSLRELACYLTERRS